MSTKSVLKLETFSTGHSDTSAQKKVNLRSWYGHTKNKASTHQQKQSIPLASAENCSIRAKQHVLISKSMEPTFGRLESKRARDAFVAAELINGIASQIRVLRQQRGWSQKDLADKLGTSQGVVSRLEDPSYGRFSIKTLLDLGCIFDVSIVARFLPFSQAVPVTWDTRKEALEAEPFDEDVKRICFMSSIDTRYIGSRKFETEFSELLRSYSEQDLREAASSSLSKKYEFLALHSK